MARLLTYTRYLVVVPVLALPIAALALFVGLRTWSTHLTRTHGKKKLAGKKEKGHENS